MVDTVRLACHAPVIGALLAVATPKGSARPDTYVAGPSSTGTPSRASAMSADSKTSALRTGAAAALGLLHLNHVFLTIDPATYAAICDSKFLKTELGVFEVRTTRRGDITYTGAYLYGDHTYFEFFSSAERTPTGPYGLAFGVDAEGDAKKVAPTIEETLVTRALNEQLIPWFKMGKLPRSDASLPVTWIMEYVPEFLKRWNPQTGTPDGITRSAVLTRYAAALGDKQSTKFLEDVSAVEYTLTASDFDALLAKAKEFGCTVERGASGATVRTTKEELRLSIGETTRLTALHLKLRRVVPAAEHQFGASHLSIHADATATWTF